MSCAGCGGEATAQLVRVRPRVTAAVFSAALAASWVIFGTALHDLIEGMDSRHGSEEVLGEALQGRRHQVFLASKFCTGDGHLPPETPVPRIIDAVEGSLRRLRTDHLDLLHIHSCDRLERLLAPRASTRRSTV